MHLSIRALQPITHATAENFRRGGVHEIGTVFTVSAEFGVQARHTWGLQQLVLQAQRVKNVFATIRYLRRLRLDYCCWIVSGFHRPQKPISVV